MKLETRRLWQYFCRETIRAHTGWRWWGWEEIREWGVWRVLWSELARIPTPGSPTDPLLHSDSSLGRKSSCVSVTLHITTLSPFACIFSRKGQERKIIDSIWGGEHVTAGICLIKFYLQLHSPWKISEPSTALLTPALYVAKQLREGRELIVWLSWVFSGSCCEFQDVGSCGDRWSLSEPPSVVQSGSITAGMLATG